MGENFDGEGLAEGEGQSVARGETESTPGSGSHKSVPTQRFRPSRNDEAAGFFSLHLVTMHRAVEEPDTFFIKKKK